MTAFPTVAVVTTNVDQTTDQPANARGDILDLMQKFNLIMAARGALDGYPTRDIDGKTIFDANFYAQLLSGVPKIQLAAGVYLWLDIPNSLLKLNISAIDYTLITTANLPVVPSSSGFSNRLINGNFDYWARGTSFNNPTGTVSACYNADRWTGLRNSAANNITFSRVAVTGISGAAFGLKAQRTAGDTQTNDISVGQMIAPEDALPLLGQTANFSIYAKVGANFSGTALNLIVNYGDGTHTNNILNGTGWTAGATNAISSPTTTLVNYKCSVAIPSSAKMVSAMITYTPVGTAGADDSFTIAQGDLRAGILGSYEFRPAQVELALCQRFFCQIGGIDAFENFGTGLSLTSTTGYLTVQLPQVMRATPTLISAGLANMLTQQTYGSGSVAPSALAIASGALVTNKVRLLVTTGSANFNNAEPFVMYANNNTGSYLQFIAEL